MSKNKSMLFAREKRRDLSGNATLVIVEGHTEEKYFADLARKYRNISTFVLRGQGTDPVSLVEYACKLYEKGRQGNVRQQRASAKAFPPKIFDKIFIVFDEDEKPEQRLKALAAIEEFNATHKKVRMEACDSRPNFELWVLLHYERVHPNPYSIADIDNKVRRHICSYSKAMDDLLELIEHATGTALANTKYLRESPSRESSDCFTNVDALIMHCKLDERG